MAITNPNKLINVQELSYFESKLAAKYQTKSISAVSGLSANTVEGAITELLGKINALPSSIVPKGTKAFSALNPSTDLVAANVGFMWNISDAFTTTSDFAEGSGHSIPAGANVYVANVGTAAEPSYKYDIFAGMYDLSGYALKSEMSITDVSGDSTKKNIQLKSGLNQDVIIAHQDISGKADKDTDAVVDNIAVFDGNGNPVDSGHALSEYKTKQSSVSDPSADGSGLTFIDSITQDANGVITPHKKTVQTVSASTSGVGGQAGLMTPAQAEQLAGIDNQLAGKADKVSSATNGNFAGLDSNGNLTDSGSKASDFKTKQTAVTSPSASGNALAFIDTISQNANGEIEATKKNIEIAADSDIDEIFA